MKENKEIEDLLLASYPVPFVSDDYRINVYLYSGDSYKAILFHDKYYPAIPRENLVSQPYLLEEKWCIICADEFAICINGDVCKPERRLGALAECLFIAATTVGDRVESEEFGAHVLGDAFKTIAPLLDSGLATADASSLRGMETSVYRLPLLFEDFRITLNLYDEPNDEVVEKLRDAYRDKMLTGTLDLLNVHGFVVEPSKIELAVFIKCDAADDMLMQQVILVHELFHAVTKVISYFNDSTELGARIYRVLFNQFVAAMASPAQG